MNYDIKELEVYDKTKKKRTIVRFEVTEVVNGRCDAQSMTYDRPDELSDYIVFIDNKSFNAYPIKIHYCVDGTKYQTYWRFESQHNITYMDWEKALENTLEKAGQIELPKIVAYGEEEAVKMLMEVERINKTRTYIYEMLVDLDNKSEWGLCDKTKHDLLIKIYKKLGGQK
jgi:hypothetical protein